MQLQIYKPIPPLSPFTHICARQNEKQREKLESSRSKINYVPPLDPSILQGINTLGFSPYLMLKITEV